MFKSVGLAMALVGLWTGLTFGQAPDLNADDDNQALITFVYLGQFTDRGLTGLFARVALKQDNDEKTDRVNGTKEKPTPLPAELAALLSPRENHLADGTAKLPELPFVFDVDTHEDQSPEAILERIRTYGLLELLYNENSKLLDSPLTQRKALMARFHEIVTQYNTALAPLFVKGMTSQKMIMIAGHLRRTSVELDMEILKALNHVERARLAKIVTHVLPDAIADAKALNEKCALGSGLVDAQMKVEQEKNSKQ